MKMLIQHSNLFMRYDCNHLCKKKVGKILLIKYCIVFPMNIFNHFNVWFITKTDRVKEKCSVLKQQTRHECPNDP